jgi:hypothetical protein
MKMLSRNLFKEENESSTYVDIKITEQGDLHILRNSFGPGDFESEVTAVTSAKDKDLLLLVLLEKMYAGNKNALEEFVKFARSKNISIDTFRWP